MTNAVEELLGKLTDVDSHEITSISLWPEVFGEVGARFAPISKLLLSGGGPNTPNVEMSKDATAITEANVWQIQPRVLAPGAMDMLRRRDVMDFVGIRRQLLFPGFGLTGITSRRYSKSEFAELTGLEPENIDLVALQSDIYRAHNEWAIRQAKIDPDRLRPVALLMTESVSSMIAEAERLLAEGIRAFWIPSGTPPGGKSPAHADLDPFWTLLENAQAPALNHLGGEFGFYEPFVWRNEIPDFDSSSLVLETRFDPYSFATTSIAPSHFLMVMVLGGVFERHPNLRFGAIECGANWLAPLAEDLDMWAELSPRLRKSLSLRPSEYIQRNVRVTPFHTEKVGKFIERYGFEDVYCFSTDYPHIEGGQSPIADFVGSLQGHSDAVLEKFFVTNGQLLIPPLGM